MRPRRQDWYRRVKTLVYDRTSRGEARGWLAACHVLDRSPFDHDVAARAAVVKNMVPNSMALAMVDRGAVPEADWSTISAASDVDMILGRTAGLYALLLLPQASAVYRCRRSDGRGQPSILLPSTMVKRPNSTPMGRCKQQRVTTTRERMTFTQMTDDWVRHDLRLLLIALVEEKSTIIVT
jgi:hypothetical protein